MIDLSSVADFSSVAFRFLASNSSAIPRMVEFRRLRVLFCFVGRFWRIGRTGPIRKTNRERALVSLSLPNDSNTSTTGEFLPSNAWKSCPKPAIPTESSLMKQSMYVLRCRGLD